MFFGFGRKREKHTSSDREHMIARDRADIGLVLDKWHPSNRLVLAVLLANDWRLFIDKFGSIYEFEWLPHSMQMEYLEKLLAYSIKVKRDSEATAGAPNAKSMELLSESLSSRFLASYVICLIEKDREWEDELAPKLDQLLEVGWAGSFGSFPLSSEQKFFPIDHPAKPHTTFTRLRR